MYFKELTAKLISPLWRVREVEIEGIDVREHWDENDDEGWVTVKDFEVSDDDTLDIFFHIGAPNGTKYKVELLGKIEDGADGKDFEFTEEYEVISKGRLRIDISEKVEEHIA